MRNVVLFTGEPGSGKSTLLKCISKDRKYKVITYGSVMLKEGLKEGIVKNRDELRYLPIGKQRKLQEFAERYIARQKGNIIVDTHVTVERKGRLVPGTPNSLVKTLHVAAMIYVTANIDDIIMRRKKDKTRKREEEPKYLIEIQNDVNLAASAYYSTSLNIPLYIIYNENGKLTESQKTLKGYLKEIFGN